MSMVSNKKSSWGGATTHSAKPNWKNRTLLHGDNLDFLRSMNSETVDLIATDPPFNKGRDFHATPDSLTKGASFQDRWSWNKDVHESWVDKITDDFPDVMNVIQGSRNSYGDDMGAFLCFMGVRLLEMRRVLKNTGSIYLHCDPTASHYLKELMDAVFGRENFRNEIVWKRATGPKGSNHIPKKFGAMHDIILFYCKNYADWTFADPWKPLHPQDITTRFPLVDDMGRRYKDDSAHIWGIPFDAKRPNLCYEWRGFKNPPNKCWRFMKSRLEEEYQKGNFAIITDKKGKRKLQRRMYADTYRGERIDDWWGDIMIPMGKEKQGYPTQKPVALYERIIKTSSKEGDIVLDPFCGCATTCVAAEKLKRQWVGIDIWDKAHKTVISRLKDEGFLAGPKDKRPDLFITEGKITYAKRPLRRTDGGLEAVPFLETRMKQFDDSEHDPYSNKEKKQMLIEQHGSYCQGCGIHLHERYLELDHREPRSGGGSNLLRNRILLCGPCNKLKRDLYTIPWLRKENKKLGYMIDERVLVNLKY